MTLHRLRYAALVFAARGTELFGRTGWLGLVACVVATIWFVQVWEQRQQSFAGPAEPVIAMPLAEVSPPAMTEMGTTLAREDEQALLLTQIQQVAVSHGLAWTAADYKLVPGGESVPASLEVRCTLKGGYPPVRAALAQWLQQVPGLAIRDLTLNRPSSEVAEVEAKLQLVIFMRSDAPEVRP